jgi:NADPH-dependent 2,4-dienoyl-CoA reductase/sulfur reductase-like enzyme
MDPNLKVVIIGAGPAGVRAAQVLVAAGLRPLLIDEGTQSGGQIYRQQPAGFSRNAAQLYDTEASKAEALHHRFAQLQARIDYLPETLAWQVRDNTVHAMSQGKALALPYDALLLCTGATDRLMPLPGWDLAGCYSLGGAQVALKSQACAIGRRVVFTGTGPLLYLVAYQYLKAGAGVAAVLDTSPRVSKPATLLRLLARPRLIWRGLRMQAALRRAGVIVANGITPQRIRGDEQQGVSEFCYQEAKGASQTVACDAVAIGYHLRPETQLADLAQCAFGFDALTRQWLPVVDQQGRSSVKNVYLAGDGKVIAGADAAEISGQLAAYAVLADAGYPVSSATLAALLRQQQTMQRFKQGLAEAFPWPHHLAASLPDETIVCRCECISAGELRRVTRETGAREANRAKAFSRVGMGRCQGRYCANAAAEIIAAETGVPIASAGRLRGQSPVKPLPFSIQQEEA